MRDASYSMAVITPSYPAMNSTFNVSLSTLRTISNCFAIADTQCLSIHNGELPWNALFAPSSFFDDYRRYIEV